MFTSILLLSQIKTTHTCTGCCTVRSPGRSCSRCTTADQILQPGIHRSVFMVSNSACIYVQNIQVSVHNHYHDTPAFLSWVFLVTVLEEPEVQLICVFYLSVGKLHCKEGQIWTEICCLMILITYYFIVQPNSNKQIPL